jgi:endonuclease G
MLLGFRAWRWVPVVVLGSTLIGTSLSGCRSRSTTSDNNSYGQRNTSSSRKSQKKRKRTTTNRNRAAATAGAGAVAVGQAMRNTSTRPGQDNSNLFLGNPTSATKQPDNYLLARAQHAMSYNQNAGGPNWVSWHLEASNLGDVERGSFRPDPMLPTDWQIRPTDYRGSGYDRGHVCPSGDRTATKEDNDATFVMSNMLPQTAALNQHVWKDLEDYSRELAMQGNELYIIAGGIGEKERIARGKVRVPQSCWKILLVLPNGDNDLGRINTRTRVIAVLMPNEESQSVENARWTQYVTSVAQLERATGYNFLSALPASVQNTLEQKIDRG